MQSAEENAHFYRATTQQPGLAIELLKVNEFRSFDTYPDLNVGMPIEWCTRRAH